MSDRYLNEVASALAARSLLVEKVGQTMISARRRPPQSVSPRRDGDVPSSTVGRGYSMSLTHMAWRLRMEDRLVARTMAISGVHGDVPFVGYKQNWIGYEAGPRVLGELLRAKSIDSRWSSATA